MAGQERCGNGASHRTGNEERTKCGSLQNRETEKGLNLAHYLGHSSQKRRSTLVRSHQLYGVLLPTISVIYLVGRSEQLSVL